MMNDARQVFLQRSIDIALEGVRTDRGGPFGAVIVRSGEVIAQGCNQVTSAFDPTAHAEIVAIRAACAQLQTFELGGCELYASCEPCPMCLAAIYWARIERVYYGCDRNDAARAGFDDDFLYRELNLPPSQRKLALTSMMRDQALATFDAWRAKPDRKSY